MGKAKVLLLGWDAADWKIISPLLDNGEMPNLAKVVEQGVTGNLMTLQPALSPMLWASIATGKRADKHGILGFTCVDEKTQQIRPFQTTDRKTNAVWNILNQEGYTPHVVNWFCGHPPEPLRGSDTSELVIRQVMRNLHSKGNEKLPNGAVYPESLQDTIASLRVWAEDMDAQTIQLFVPNYRDVDQEKDRRLESIARQLASCLTNHAITTWLMENQPWDFIATYFGEIDHFGHGFMKYHPPRQPQIPEKDFELYNDVVNSAYRLHDLLLGRYLQLIDDDTTLIICSDHGFHADHLRPGHIPRIPAGPALEHRPVGMLAMKGPLLRKDELVHGATLLDITPTLLTLFGLPIGEDMEGRVLTEAFTDDTQIKTIPSWEERKGEAGMLAPDMQLSKDDAEALIQQFVELGYIDPPADDAEKQRVITDNEAKWNLARVYISTGQYAKALPLIEEVYDAFPLRFDVGLGLVECLCRLRLAHEGRELAHNLAQAYPGRPWAWMVYGLTELSLYNLDAALEQFKKAEKAQPSMKGLHLQLGRTYLGMRRYKEAEAAFQKGLEKDPDNPSLIDGLAQCAFRQKDYEQATTLSLKALGLQFALPLTHFRLGSSLARLGKTEEAIQSIETCTRYNPNFIHAFRILRVLYARTGQKEKAADTRLKIAEIVKTREKQKEERKVVREAMLARKQKRDALRQQASDDLAAEIALEASRPKPEIPDAKHTKPGQSGKIFVIVSGLPRSGTSLMMQMLQRGGLPSKTDGERKADIDNPEGYYEWEAVKRLAQHPEYMEQAEGHAIKVITMLLKDLPPIHQYLVLFMDRPVKEVATSQAKMIARRKGTLEKMPDDTIQEQLEKHRDTILRNLQARSHVKCLRVNYPGLISNPEEQITRIAEFLGPDHLPHPERMAEAIKPELYRNTTKSS